MKNITYINAGAGSGKTYTLIEKLTSLIQKGEVRPDQVILTTFTKKAAAEFKERAKAKLIELGMFNEARGIDSAMIGTIHSICEKMISKYWLVLGLSPCLSALSEEDQKFYISQSLAKIPTDDELKKIRSIEDWFGMSREFNQSAQKSIEKDPWLELLNKIVNLMTNYEIDDITDSETQSLDFIRQFVKTGLTLSFTKEELRNVIDELKKVATSTTTKKEISAAESELSSITAKTLFKIEGINLPQKASPHPKTDAFHAKMKDFWRTEEVYSKQEEYIKLLFNLALRWKDKYSQFKAERALVDFNDMEKYMRRLMQRKDVLSEIQKTYKYLFVDEFQDSSPIQVKIFDALSDLMEHSYWVGDPKQAIYDFRGADTSLTNAVAETIDTGKNGSSVELLTKSYRSVPEIVELNNDIFCKAFADMLKDERVRLDYDRTSNPGVTPLQYFRTWSVKKGSDEKVGIMADYIKVLLEQDVRPDEIAILAGSNTKIKSITESLLKYNIPVNAKIQIVEHPTYQLLMSLLKIVEDSHNQLSKASVAFIIDQDFDTKRIIEEKILNDSSVAGDLYLGKVETIKRLIDILPELNGQSIPSIIDALVSKLNLYEEIKKVEPSAAIGVSCLQALRKSASDYENRCLQMTLPATINGFISYTEKCELAGQGDTSGVQVCTYHASKGLEWKYVVLTSLSDEILCKMIEWDVCGVHYTYNVVPSAANLYPAGYIRVMPYIYSSTTTEPTKSIFEEIQGTKLYDDVKQKVISEKTRLLYVGMTRPTDALIINVEQETKKKPQQWLKDIGLDIDENYQPGGASDIFRNGMPFKDITLTETAVKAIKAAIDNCGKIRRLLKFDAPAIVEREPRNVSPSYIDKKGSVISSFEISERMQLGILTDMTAVGNSIHQVFAGIEYANGKSMEKVINVFDAYGQPLALVEPKALIQTWDKLTKYLSNTYGEAVRTYHERPFRMERDGQLLVGSIDFVWQTKMGDILVDFKTCPMGENAILDPESDHYVGKYAGQLDAYQDALEASGEKVLKRLIFYPVSGLLVEVSRAE